MCTEWYNCLHLSWDDDDDDDDDDNDDDNDDDVYRAINIIFLRVH